jgi:hypothetical protein
MKTKNFAFRSLTWLGVSLIALSLMIVVPSAVQADVTFVASGDSRSSSGAVDNGVNITVLADIVQATIDEGADFILITGDLVYGSANVETLESQLTTFRDTVQPLYDAGIGVYPSRGNHDANYDTDNEAWNNVFTGTYALSDNGPPGEENVTFSFTRENVFIVGLDQYGPTHPHRVNQTWLDTQFGLNTEPHVFVFGHEPAFKVNHQDCLDDYPIDRNTFWDSIADEGGRIYFTGHGHFYDHARLDNGDGDPDNDLHQIIVGTAGAPLTGDNQYNGNNGFWTPVRIDHEAERGYVLVEVVDQNVTVTWKRRTAAGVFEAGDEFTYSVNVIDNPRQSAR